ncbi:MAG: phosphate/phosphite/phosphonate ABC transporter substrate-binding protein [Rhodospirillales bacterium]|nr:phosphate/phosphite/phosphonate ABC transporter substrate-binding protein [Rhodospirillales bacterium]
MAVTPKALLAAATTPAIRFGLTAVVVRENLRFYDRWSAYLESRIGRKVAFVQRRSYREIMDMLEADELDFAWICGFPFVQASDTVGLLVVPLYGGVPLYQSYIITHRDNPVVALSQLEGSVFAYSDPNSNSGFLVPRAQLAALGRAPDRFFRLTFFTYSHAETVQAVSERVADAGAVDSYVWDYLRRFQPEQVERTKIIQRSDLYGFPPIVYRPRTPPTLRETMARELVAMTGTPEGRALLDDLMLDGFSRQPPKLFDGIRRLAAGVPRAPVGP